MTTKGLAFLIERSLRNAARFRNFQTKGLTLAPSFFKTGNLFPKHLVTCKITGR